MALNKSLRLAVHLSRDSQRQRGGRRARGPGKTGTREILWRRCCSLIKPERGSGAIELRPRIYFPGPTEVKYFTADQERVTVTIAFSSLKVTGNEWGTSCSLAGLTFLLSLEGSLKDGRSGKLRSSLLNQVRY